MKRKPGVFMIVASLLIGLIAALPWIVNNDNTILLPGLILGGILFLAGVVSMLKNRMRRLDDDHLPQA